MKRIALLVLLFAVTLTSSIAATPPKKTEALSGSEFQAGRIIDDALFFNGSAMDANQVQAFLNSKVPRCDTWGTQSYAGTTAANYGASKGQPAPFTCLKEYRQDTWGIPADAYCNGFTPGNKSAAQIIAEVGVSCGISQKTILITLQKEQSFVTDDWPLPNQYAKATGYACPDNPPAAWLPLGCDPEYSGFFKQVYYGARQFKRYQKDTNIFTSYRPYRTNYIQYNPNAGCGGTNVYIQNQATSSLYTYTPYQPNASALANLYGSGDSCGAYGNRNFWRFYSDWFGNALGSPFSWDTVSTNLYDANKGTTIDPSQSKAGERLFVSLKVKNTGTETWYRNGANPTMLAATYPSAASSIYCDKATWFSCNRPAQIKEDAVPPGAEGHFEFYIQLPSYTSEFREFFKPVLENKAWMGNDNGYHIYAKTNNTFDWGWQSYGAYLDPQKTIPADTSNLARNQTVYITLYAKNTSASLWYNAGNNPITLGTASPLNRASALCNSSWLSSCNRPALMQEPLVRPGQTASFSFSMTTPNNLGAYREYIKPLSELNSWMRDDPNHIYVNVTR